VNERSVASLIETYTNFRPDSVKRFDETSANYIFEVEVVGYPTMMAKIEKAGARMSSDGTKKGFHFNDPLSVDRQAYLCSLLRDEAGLPVPEVYAVVNGAESPFLLMQKMPGRTWRHYLEDNDFSEQAYLKSLRHLGTAIAKTQKLTFDTYGAIVGAGKIYPAGIINFADQVKLINNRRIERERKMGALSLGELDEVQRYFVESFADVRDALIVVETKPVFVMGDLHPMQFLVDPEGVPSGFVDNEFCQAGHSALEMFNVGLQITNYFVGYDLEIAREEFFKGFHAAGGSYDSKDGLNLKLEDLLATGQMLVAATAYYGITSKADPLRSSWSGKFKELVLKSVREGVVDRSGYQKIIREKTQQPEVPNGKMSFFNI